jgi:hypothetical protein
MARLFLDGRLAFSSHVAAPIPHFVSFEVRNFIRMICRVRPVAGMRHGAFVSMVRMEMIVHVAAEIRGAVKPGASANEDTTHKPFRAVIAVGSASIRRNVIVPVRAHWRHSNVNADLRFHFGSGHGQANCSECSRRKIFEFVHNCPRISSWGLANGLPLNIGFSGGNAVSQL